MQLIIIYGPPASGKLTIAKALAKKTGYPLLHNHVIADFASIFFAYGTDGYVKLASELRLKAIETAIKGRTDGLIMTFAYGLETKEGKHDEAVLKLIANRIKDKNGSVFFVRLVCGDGVLMKRVGRKDREKFNKLTSPSTLKKILRDYKKTKEAVPFADSVTVNSGSTSPTEVVKYILKKINKNLF